MERSGGKWGGGLGVSARALKPTDTVLYTCSYAWIGEFSWRNTGWRAWTEVENETRSVPVPELIQVIALPDGEIGWAAELNLNIKKEKKKRPPITSEVTLCFGTESTDIAMSTDFVRCVVGWWAADSAGLLKSATHSSWRPCRRMSRSRSFAAHVLKMAGASSCGRIVYSPKLYSKTVPCWTFAHGWVLDCVREIVDVSGDSNMNT